MAKSTRSIDRGNTKKGQRLLAFFLGCPALAALSAAPTHAHDLHVQVDHKSSSGLFYEEQWRSKGLSTAQRQAIGSLDASVGATAQMDWGDVRIARQYKGYYRGTSNVLFLAAMSEHGDKFQIPQRDGRYSLDADLQVLDATQVTFAKQLQWGSQQFTLRPHVFTIHEYQSFRTRGSLQVQGPDARISGGVFERVGTRDYGFLVNDKKDSGWGWGLDAEAQLQHGPWQLHLQLNNLLSQLRFSTVHYSRDVYHIEAVDGEIQIGGNPSMTGVYGHKRATERLPVQTWSTLQHQSWSWLQGGLYSVGNDVAPWLGVQWSHGPWRAQAQTVQGRNLSLMGWWQSPRGITLGAGVTHAGGATRMGQLQARWQW